MQERAALLNGDAQGGDHGALKNGTSSAAASIMDGPPSLKVEGNGSSSHAEVGPTLDDKASLAIVMCVVFLGDTARGIFFPTLWTYVKAMGGDRIALGYCVGAFSFGRVMISPYFGGLSTKHGYQKVLMAASGLIATGALGYALAWNNTALIAAQIVMGVGSGTLGVTRAYVADKSTPEQRTYLLAYTTAVQYAGFTCMPFVGGFLAFLMKDSRIPILGNFLVLTSFTAPAFLMMVAALVLMGLLRFVFKDSIPKPKHKTKNAKQVSASTKKSTPLVKTEADIVYSNASAAKYLMGAPSDVSLARSGWTSEGDDDDSWPAAEYGKNGSGNGPIGLFVDSDDEAEGEAMRRPSSAASLSAPPPPPQQQAGRDTESGLLMDPDGGTKGGPNRNNVGSNGYGSVPADDDDDQQGGQGAGEAVAKAGAWCRMPSLPDMLIYGGFLLNMSTKGTIACFETLGAEYAMTHFGMTSAEAGSTFATFGTIGVVSLLSMRVICRFYNDVQIVLGGMGVMIVACLMFVTKPEGASGLPLFMIAVFLMYSVGYPIGHTAVLGLFSKVVGAQPQGALLGWFGSAGSLARIAFPVIAGVISEKLGTSKLFMALVLTLSITVSILFAFRKPYLNCVEITKRRSLSRHAATAAVNDKASGNGTNAGSNGAITDVSSS